MIYGVRKYVKVPQVVDLSPTTDHFPAESTKSGISYRFPISVFINLETVINTLCGIFAAVELIGR
jgi:hypothetical protein